MTNIPNDKLMRRTTKFLHHLTAYQSKLVTIRDDYYSSYFGCYMVMPIACFLAIIASVPIISICHQSEGWMYATIFPMLFALMITSVINGVIQHNCDVIDNKLSDYVKLFNTYSLEISQKHVKEPDAKRLDKMRRDVVVMLKYAASVKSEPMFQFIDVHFKPF